MEKTKEKPVVKRESSLKDKAIDIKGKSYVLVADRIVYFNEKYPNGQITTELLTLGDERVALFQAKVYPDAKDQTRFFTGYSEAIKGDGFINKSAHIENAETSAVGRALAMMGIGVIDSVASVDEINKAEVQSKQKDPFNSALTLIDNAKNPEVLEMLAERVRASENFTETQKTKLLSEIAKKSFDEK